MKLIAHRGASLLFQENSIEGLVYAARIGADAVECDVRRTKDLQYVIFHDGNLSRATGFDAQISDLTLSEMRHYLSLGDYRLITLSDLISGYKEQTPVLLHMKFAETDARLAHQLSDSGVDFIIGAQQPETAAVFSKYFPTHRILAFMPGIDDHADFAKNGAGIIRIWEPWLERADISAIRRAANNAEIWIMSRDAGGSMDGNVESLGFFEKIGADGVLLNDITLGIKWRNRRHGKD